MTEGNRVFGRSEAHESIKSRNMTHTEAGAQLLSSEHTRIRWLVGESSPWQAGMRQWRHGPF